MTFYYNGEISFDRELSESEINDIADIIGLGKIQAETNSINIDAYGGYREAEFDLMLEYCKEHAIGIDNMQINYHGDYDGSYRYDKEQDIICDYSSEQCAIIDASTDELLDELKRRGLIVTIAEAV